LSREYIYGIAEKSSGSSRKSIYRMDGAKMILKGRVEKELKNFSLMMSKGVWKVFQVPRWKEIYRQQCGRIFSRIPQGLNQSLVVTRLAGARLAPQL
jgi:hypothetical protein